MTWATRSPSSTSAISVCGPVERFREQLETVPELVLNTCRDLSRLLGHRAAV